MPFSLSNACSLAIAKGSTSADRMFRSSVKAAASHFMWWGGLLSRRCPQQQGGSGDVRTLPRCRCLVDQKPQRFDPERAAILCNLAELVVRELESAWAVQYQRRCLTWLARLPAQKHPLLAASSSTTDPAAHTPQPSWQGAQGLWGEQAPWQGNSPDGVFLLRRHSLKLLRAMDCYKEPYLFVDVASPRWAILHINDAVTQKTGTGALSPRY